MKKFLILLNYYCKDKNFNFTKKIVCDKSLNDNIYSLFI